MGWPGLVILSHCQQMLNICGFKQVILTIGKGAILFLRYFAVSDTEVSKRKNAQLTFKMLAKIISQ